MKAYKIDLSMLDSEAREDVSATLQRHSFRLGYAWQYGGKKVQHEYCPVLCFEADGEILVDEDTYRFNKWSNTEISITDFLALTPEDVQDDVITTTEPAEWLLVTQGESRRLVPMGVPIRNTEREPLSVEFFTRTVAERFLPKEGK